MNACDVVNVGPVELRPGEVCEAIASGREYLVSFRTVYQLRHTRNSGELGRPIHRHRDGLPLVRRGRFTFETGESVNRLVGFPLVNVERGNP
jgi:hypothetical protein